jgi:Tol biopolymer transport system component
MGALGRLARPLIPALILLPVLAVGPKAVAIRAGHGEGDAALLSDGPIVFEHSGDIYRVSPTGKGVRLLIPNGSQPAATPDGKELAFVRQVAGIDTIFTATSSGAGITSLTVGVDPSWSPDASQLAFDDGVNIWTINADGSGLTEIVTGAQSTSPSWSPDGSKIAFVRVAPSYQWNVYTMNPDGSGLQDVTNDTTVENYAPSWSPDGSRIVYERTEFGQAVLYAIDPDGQNRHRLTQRWSSLSNDTNPSYSPDGTQIVFDSNRVVGPEYHLWVMSAQGRRQRELPRVRGTNPIWLRR